jgi:hypothetical protein
VRKSIRRLIEGTTTEICGEATNSDEAAQKRCLSLKRDVASTLNQTIGRIVLNGN